MSLESIALAAANRINNAAEAKKIRVYQSGFTGASEVLADLAPCVVADHLVANGGYRASATVDGLWIRLPDPCCLTAQTRSFRGEIAGCLVSGVGLQCTGARYRWERRRS